MILTLQNIKKSIGIREILSGVSFGVHAGEKVALVGVNGAGKTSVFRVITGEWEADEGEIVMQSGITPAYLPQQAEPTGSDGNLYDALDSVYAPLMETESQMRMLEKEMAGQAGSVLEGTLKRYDALQQRFAEGGGFERESRVKGVLRGLGFDEKQWQQPFDSLSGGERTRAMLGRLLISRTGLLLLDEPTNHLDIGSVAWLEEYLSAYEGAVIVISHDRYFIDRVCTRTVEIESRRAVVYNGNYSYFVQKKQADRQLYEKHHREQQKIIRHHEAVIKELRSYKTEAAIIRAKSREKLLAKIERMDTPARDPATMRLRLTPSIKSGYDVLFAEELGMAFGPPLFSGISFEIKKGNRMALIGPNGVGKTTLMKIIVGELAPLAGRVHHGVNLRIGYYDQSHAFSEESLAKTILQEIADTYPKLPQTQIRTTLGAFMFVGDDVFKPIAALSGGERGRVQLAKIMLTGANFLVLDEPTNHLDLVSKEILEEALRAFDGTLLYISHDRYFINNTATHVMELSPEGLAVYPGNYDFYLEQRRAAGGAAAASDTEGHAATHKSDYQAKKEAEAAARKHTNRIARLEGAIAEKEAAIADLEALLATEEVGRNATDAARIYSEKTAMETSLEALLQEWEEAQ